MAYPFAMSRKGGSLVLADVILALASNPVHFGLVGAWRPDPFNLCVFPLDKIKQLF